MEPFLRPSKILPLKISTDLTKLPTAMDQMLLRDFPSNLNAPTAPSEPPARITSPPEALSSWQTSAVTLLPPNLTLERRLFASQTQRLPSFPSELAVNNVLGDLTFELQATADDEGTLPPLAVPAF